MDPEQPAADRGLDLRLGAGAPTCCRCAGRRLHVEGALPPLLPFTCPDPGRPAPRPPCPGTDPASEELVYDGPGWVGGRLLAVTCSRAGAGFVVRIEGLPALLVSRAGCAVLAGAPPPAGVDALVEAVLGPGLTLALALHGTFALHAGAVVSNGRLAVFLGESGAGKSTIARTLGAVRGWRRVADDVLPAEVRHNRLLALPHYPQLKLTAVEQYGLDEPAAVPVAVVYELRGGPDQRAGVALEPVGRRDAAVLLAGHTVAARLFDAALLERHLAFCTASAMSVPVRRLTFAKRPESLPEIAEAVGADLESLPR